MTAQEARKKADKATVNAILCSIEFYAGEGKAEHKIDSKVGTGVKNELTRLGYSINSDPDNSDVLIVGW